MGLLVSINGVDFEPYSDAVGRAPLVGRQRATQVVQPIRRETDHPDDFEKNLAEAKVRKAASEYAKANEPIPHQSRKAVFAHELMSEPVITIQASARSEEALQLLDEHQIRHLPVVNEEEVIVGILSDRNLLMAKAGQSLEELMTRRLIVAREDTPLVQITQAMLDEKIHSVPVVDADRRPVGIVTSTDILQSLLLNPNIDLLV